MGCCFSKPIGGPNEPCHVAQLLANQVGGYVPGECTQESHPADRDPNRPGGPHPETSDPPFVYRAILPAPFNTAIPGGSVEMRKVCSCRWESSIRFNTGSNGGVYLYTTHPEDEPFNLKLILERGEGDRWTLTALYLPHDAAGGQQWEKTVWRSIPGSPWWSSRRNAVLLDESASDSGSFMSSIDHICVSQIVSSLVPVQHGFCAGMTTPAWYDVTGSYSWTRTGATTRTWSLPASQGARFYLLWNTISTFGIPQSQYTDLEGTTHNYSTQHSIIPIYAANAFEWIDDQGQGPPPNTPGSALYLPAEVTVDYGQNPIQSDQAPEFPIVSFLYDKTDGVVNFLADFTSGSNKNLLGEGSGLVTRGQDCELAFSLETTKTQIGENLQGDPETEVKYGNFTLTPSPYTLGSTCGHLNSGKMIWYWQDGFWHAVSGYLPPPNQFTHSETATASIMWGADLSLCPMSDSLPPYPSVDGTANGDTIEVAWP